MSFNLQPLEARRHLTLVWANRGPGDGFGANYGDNAVVARLLVDAAVADWNAAVTTPRGYKVTIRATNIEPGRRNSTTLGDTAARSIRLDTDAAGGGWYFDRDLADNTEFDKVLSPDAAESSTVKGTDFFSVTLHELGHALGFKDKDNPFITQLPRRDVKDFFHTSREELMNAAVADGTRHLITAYDILHTPWGKKEFGKTGTNLSVPRVFSTVSLMT